MTESRWVRIVGLTLACSPVGIESAHSDLVLSTFVGPNGGAWSSAPNWTPATVPDNSGADTFDVTIPGSALVEVDTSPTITALTIGLGAVANVQSGRTLRIPGGVLHDDGLLQLNGSAGPARLELPSPLVVDGGGELRMVGAQAQIRTLIDLTRLTNGPSHSIRGQGLIGDTGNDFLRITNEGLIEATTGILTFRLGSDVDMFENVNTGVIRASGSSISFTSSDFNCEGGVIEAVNGKSINFTSTAVKGGLITSANGGASINVNSTIFEGSSLGGLVRLLGFELVLTGDTTLNGKITIEGGATLTTVMPVDGVTLAGTGTIEGVGTNSRIWRGGSVPPMILPSTWTVRGTLRFGQGGSPVTLINQGLIEATSAAGPLTVFPSEVPGWFKNESLMQAVANDLIVTGGLCDNTNGLIQANPNRIVRTRTTMIKGGTIRALASGQIVLDENGPGRFTDLLLDGTVNQLNDRDQEFSGVVEQNGTYTILSSTALTGIIVVGPTVLSGSGDIRLTGANAQIRGKDATSILTNGAAHTIHGEGRFGDNINLSVINEGLIIADRPRPLVLDPSGSFTNTAGATLRVTAGRTLTAPPATWTNSGTIDIDAGALLDRSGAITQSGGVTNVEGTLKFTGGSFVLNGGMLTGTGVVEGAVSAPGGVVEPDGLEITGTYVQGAACTLAVTLGVPSDEPPLLAGGAVTLNGTLSVGLAPGFVPVDGESLVVLTASSIDGSFSNVIAPIDACIEMETIIEATIVRVVFHEAGSGVFGDLNGDGFVDSIDVQILLADWGPCRDTCCPADLDGSGTVDGRDLTLVLGAWDRARERPIAPLGS